MRVHYRFSVINCWGSVWFSVTYWCPSMTKWSSFRYWLLIIIIEYEPRSKLLIFDVFFLNIHHTKRNNNKHIFSTKNVKGKKCYGTSLFLDWPIEVSLHICDQFWHNGEEVFCDIWQVSDSTNQQCVLLSCWCLHSFVQTLNDRQVLIDVHCSMQNGWVVH